MKNLDLRSSSFLNYSIGYYTPRREQLEWDLKGERKPITNDYQIKAMNKGIKHEKHGIAKYVQVFKEIPNYILKDQKRFVVPNWLNSDEKETVSLSSTPDGISKDFSCIVEVKTTRMAKFMFKEFPKHYLPQIYGQMLVLNLSGHSVKKSHLVNFSTIGSKIWEINYNQNFIDYLSSLLKEYSLALLSGNIEDLSEKPETYEGNILEESVKLIYEDK